MDKNNDCNKITVEYEPYKHKGMRISFSGMMRQVKEQLEEFEKFKDSHSDEEYGSFEFDHHDAEHQHALEQLMDTLNCGLSYTVKELLDHFKIMGEAFYSGDFQKVDNVLQLWCLKPGKENGE